LDEFIGKSLGCGERLLARLIYRDECLSDRINVFEGAGPRKGGIVVS
jgi:hypothetical protein